MLTQKRLFVSVILLIWVNAQMSRWTLSEQFLLGNVFHYSWQNEETLFMFWRRSIIKEVCIRLGPSFQSFWREMTNYIRNSPFTIKNNVINNHWVFSHNFLYWLLSFFLFLKEIEFFVTSNCYSSRSEQNWHQMTTHPRTSRSIVCTYLKIV